VRRGDNDSSPSGITLVRGAGGSSSEPVGNPRRGRPESLPIDPREDTIDLMAAPPRGAVSGASMGEDTERPRGRTPVVQRGFHAREPGSRIEQYVIEEVLGSGGMGVVYAATDTQLGRQVAIKVLRSDSPRDITLASRLLREAQSMAKLSHPNVVTVYEIGTSEREIFIVMEFVRGSTLKRWLTSPRSPLEILKTFIEAGRGLQAAHRAHIIHRDFKPDNVLIDEEGRVRVTDFGLARSTEDKEAQAETTPTPTPTPRRMTPARAHRITRTGELMGTPAYMAPEQHRRLEIDERCDQFSFAVALFESLTNYHPFAVGNNVNELLNRMVRGELVEAPRDSRKLPRSLRAILVRAMSPLPDDRYPSMTELLADLERERDRGAEAARKRRVIAAGAAMLVAGAIGGTLFVMSRSGSDPAESCAARREELAPIWNADRQHQIRSAFAAQGIARADSAAEGVIRSIDRYARSWSDMAVSSCEATHVRHEQSEGMLELRSACLADRKRVLSVVVDALSRANGDLARNSDRAVRALVDLGECGNARVLAANMPEPTDAASRRKLDEIRTLLSQAHVQIFAYHFDEARPRIDQAETAARSLDYPPILGEVYLARGRLAAEVPDLPQARAHLMRASASAEAGHNDLLRARALVELVWVVGFLQRDYRQGELLVELAQATLERAGGDRAVEAELLRNAGQASFAAGKFDEALKRQRTSLAIRESHLGESSAEVAEVLVDAASTLRELGNYEEGIAYVERALEIEKKRQELGTIYANGLNELASIYVNKGWLLDAKRALQQSLDTNLSVLGEQHPLVGVTYSNLGTVAMLESDYSAAIEHLTRGLAIEERAYGPKHLEVTSTLMNLGAAYQGAGKLDEAKQRFERAAEVRRDQLGELDPQVAEALVALGDVALEQKQPQEALSYLERAVIAVDGSKARPEQRAEAHFALARALHQARRDRERVRALAIQAQGEYRAGELPGEADAVRDWLAKNGR
jgi:tetratricopeptide (TPR) repeat protein/predicted Ser/Thr protein kinase